MTSLCPRSPVSLSRAYDKTPSRRIAIVRRTGHSASRSAASICLPERPFETGHGNFRCRPRESRQAPFDTKRLFFIAQASRRARPSSRLTHPNND
jgi:hypothetical protein